MAVSIYDKYGGYNFFHDCIYDLYLEMFDHPEISYHFIGVDIERLSNLQTQYLTRAIGGPDIYQGIDVKSAHKNMDITPFQFNEIAAAFRLVFLKKGVSVEDVEVIMKFVGGHDKDIITEKTSFIDQVMKIFYRLIKKLFAK